MSPIIEKKGDYKKIYDALNLLLLLQTGKEIRSELESISKMLFSIDGGQYIPKSKFKIRSEWAKEITFQQNQMEIKLWTKKQYKRL